MTARYQDPINANQTKSEHSANLLEGHNNGHEHIGLGLALVHKLTELHGGGVQVESEYGKGSRFMIALPLNQNLNEQISNENGSEPAKAEPNPASLPIGFEERGVILLAEDNPLNSEMLVDYLRTESYSILLAENGEEALEKVANVTPILILMDIQMPKMDGLEATRRLRMDPRFASTPIITLTALAMPGDRERCLEAGADEYLSKPVNLRQLLQAIQRLTKPAE